MGKPDEKFIKLEVKSIWVVLGAIILIVFIVILNIEISHIPKLITVSS